ncbi:DUF4153 domain-containing protein, partial [Mucilaginibacter sp. 10I4]
NEDWCLRIIMIANLGLLLSLCTTLYTESKEITGAKKSGLRIAAFAFSILLIFMINPGEHQADYIRFFLFSLSFHLMVAFAAFTSRDHIQGFWQFNKTLFLRFLTSVLYSVVLFLGLAAAISSMNFLFNFKFEWDTFAILWSCIVGMFSTIFFLAGVPADTKALDTDFSYPKGLKVFTQYVLIPLATVYVAILLAYEIKILVQWQLPKGLVSNLILGYAVFGVLSLLLVYPIREQAENKWLKTYARSFYFLLIPLLGLLFTAAGTRLFRYGITEMRYFLILLAFWLLFITIYFLVSKKQNIKLIPISLSILTLLSIYGPQSAFQVSMYSQRRVLVEVFKKNNAFRDDKFTAIDSTKISKRDGSKAVATLDYLISKHDLTSLQPYFNQDLSKVADSLSKNIRTLNNGSRSDVYLSDYELRERKLTWAKKRLGLNAFDGYWNDGEEPVITKYESIIYRTESDDTYTINGYDYMIDMAAVNSADTANTKLDGMAIEKTSLGYDKFTLKINNQIFTFNVKPSIDSLNNKKLNKGYPPILKGEPNNYLIPANKLFFTQENNMFKVTLRIKRVTIGGFNDKGVNFLNGYYLIKKK